MNAAKKRTTALILAAAAGACAIAPKVPDEVRTVVSRPCVSALPERPRLFTPEELLALSPAERAPALLAFRYVMLKYAEKLEAALEECAR